MNAHQPQGGCKAAKPECVTSLTTVRHSEGPPVADLLTIIKVNTGHTPVLPSAQPSPVLLWDNIYLNFMKLVTISYRCGDWG